jgi:Rieske Fe-S protein
VDDEQTGRPRPDLSRRAVVRGAATGGLVLPLVAACGTSTGEPASGRGSGGGQGGSSEAGSGGSDGSAGSTGSAGSRDGRAGQVLVRTSQVPVGGGVIFTKPQLVVTQPTKGSFKAFSSVCTHAGCLVDQVQDGAIECPCHGSRFSVKDGSVIGGPAPRPLPSVPVTVKDGKVVTG